MLHYKKRSITYLWIFIVVGVFGLGFDDGLFLGMQLGVLIAEALLRQDWLGHGHLQY